MSREPYSDKEYEQAEPPASGGRLGRRSGIDLTSMGARAAATAVAIGVLVLLVIFFFRPRGGTPEATEGLPLEPTPALDLSQPIVTFTPGPTSTPPAGDVPTPVPTTESGSVEVEPSGTLAVGGRAQVGNTGGSGVNVRGGSGTGFEVILVVGDQTLLEVLEGPSEADGYVWWKVRLDDGTEGWMVQDYLVPVSN